MSNCKLHPNQRKSGSLCGNAECGLCAPFRTAPTASAPVNAIDAHMHVPAKWDAALPRIEVGLYAEVAEDRALFEQRRYDLAARFAEASIASGVLPTAKTIVTFVDELLAELQAGRV